jgi:molybdopterin synthase catalytic subunit
MTLLFSFPLWPEDSLFKITDKKIDQELYIIENPRCGGIVTFEGIVRNHNEGLKVKSLEYQAYEAMALKEGVKIVEHVKKEFDIEDAICVHRAGHLAIGELAVWVYVAAEHRGEAFKACEYIIDQVKFTVPIWKREHYLDKDPVWVACHHCKEYHAKRERSLGV